MSLWCGNSGTESCIGMLGYCMRRREVFVCSEAYAADRPLSFSYRHMPPAAEPAS